MTMPDRIQITHQPRTMTTPDIRAALERLVELDKRVEDVLGIPLDNWIDAIDAARAALKAEPEGEGPSNAQIEEVAKQIYKAMRFERLDSTPEWVDRGNSLAQSEARFTARAVLGGWGRAELLAAKLGVDLSRPATPQTPKDLATDQMMAANLSALLIRESGLHSPGPSTHDLLQRAAAMLVNYGLPAHPATPPAPEPGEEGPSERIISIAKAVQECAFTHEPDARLIGNVCAEDVADLCTAALATPPAPVLGEVATVAQWLQDHAPECRELGRNDWAEQCTRAATLLQQQCAPPALQAGEVEA
jgi:hypothetical protein